MGTKCIFYFFFFFNVNPAPFKHSTPAEKEGWKQSAERL